MTIFLLTAITCLIITISSAHSKKQINKLMLENTKTNKNNLELRTTFSKMSDDIENLMNISRDLTKSNNYLKKIYSDLSIENKNLVKRIEFLEQENKEIKLALRYRDMIAPGLTLTNSFVGKLKKES